ncbi:MULTISPECIES: hypothetical protein [Leeuwenhoekiella]|uniref:hypothetical protein n=1 Tax=Leeuwenhoekiella TaxID=283735 RepID=UPI000C67E700|nr:hypothetical protein [Leeuwenhoekiella sp.]|tara:strand:- start:1466 stop:1936 length:471 start_codon:yes stop_codon:yes gene_type:complete
MNKNKLKTYLLSVVVVAIWGVIGFQIYSALNPSEETLEVPKLNSSFNPKNAVSRDTFSIKNNYPDPFLGKLPAKQVPKTVQRRALPEKVDSIIFPDIQYKGMVKGSGIDQAVFAIAINGVETILSEGQKFQDVELVQGKAEEVLIQYKGQRKTILK